MQVVPMSSIDGSHCTGKMAPKDFVRESIGYLKFGQNTGNFLCSSCKFPDSKDEGYCDNILHYNIIYYNSICYNVIILL